MRFIAEDLPPPLTEKDTVIRSDPDWEQAAAVYLRLKIEADQAVSRLDEAKTRLIGLASHSSEKGSGVQVTRYWKAGNVDYKKVPQLAGVDLEEYRGASREEVRVTMAKQ